MSKRIFNRSIGILGGMGPAASVHFSQRIIKCAQRNYGAVQDSEFPELLMLNIAKPLLSYKGSYSSSGDVAAEIQAGLKRLERSGSELLVVVCNTVHQKEIFSALQISPNHELVNLVASTVQEVAAKGFKKVGVFASEDSIRNKVYEDLLGNFEIETVKVSALDQENINQVILHAMDGTLTKKDSNALRAVHRRMINQGAEATILGCTELSMLYEELQTKDQLFIDSVQVVTQLLLKKASA